MRFYTVHAPSGDPQPDRFAFVKDGFSWPAFFVPILWILWHRMWLTLIGYIIFVLVIAWIGRLAGDPYVTMAAIAGAIILGFEGNTIRRLSLENRGWRDIGESFGRNLEEAEARFFSGWSELSPVQREGLLASAGYASGSDTPASDQPILGLFPEPERTGARP
jgi:hypothetical protein